MRPLSDFRQRLVRIAKLVQLQAELGHKREVQTAHFSVRLFSVVEYTTRLQLAAGAAEQDHRELSGVVAAGEHAGAEHQHRIVERRLLALLNDVEAARNMGQLLDKELIDFEPVVRFLVGEQVVDHVVDAQIREAQGGMIVVEFECAESGGIGLKGEHQDVGHETHVLTDVLRDAVGGTRDVWLGKRGSPALQFASLGSAFNLPFDFSDRVEVFIQFELISGTDMTT